VTKRRAKGEARERLVIGAAAQLIAERGLANVRIADIAERAAMSTGHVSYYFPSKSELLMRAIRQSEEAFTDILVDQITTIRDPWARLTRLIELSAATGPGDPGWVLWFEVWSNAATDADVAKVHDELDRRAKAILHDVITYGCDQGAFRTDDPDRVALVLAALIDGLSIQLTLGAGDLTRKQLLEVSFAAAQTQLGQVSDANATSRRSPTRTAGRRKRQTAV
jgi:AcrR family transcriptional regulator